MQNRYVGDVGDYGKYGLLRALCNPRTRLRLGVVWYLVPNERKGGDGRLVGYLSRNSRKDEELAVCDPALFRVLGEIVRRGSRDVRAVRARAVLPAGTFFYERRLDYTGLKKADRLALRAAWLAEAQDSMRECDIVFLDPDNGIAGRVQKHLLKAPKFVFLDEILPYIQRGQSVLVYHHLNRRAPAETQVRSVSSLLKKAVPNGVEVTVLRYHRGTARIYAILAVQKHVAILRERISKLAAGPWGRHFALASTK